MYFNFRMLMFTVDNKVNKSCVKNNIFIYNFTILFIFPWNLFDKIFHLCYHNFSFVDYQCERVKKSDFCFVIQSRRMKSTRSFIWITFSKLNFKFHLYIRFSRIANISMVSLHVNICVCLWYAYRFLCFSSILLCFYLVFFFHSFSSASLV